MDQNKHDRDDDSPCDGDNRMVEREWDAAYVDAGIMSHAEFVKKWQDERSK